MKSGNILNLEREREREREETFETIYKNLFFFFKSNLTKKHEWIFFFFFIHVDLTIFWYAKW